MKSFGLATFIVTCVFLFFSGCGSNPDPIEPDSKDISLTNVRQQKKDEPAHGDMIVIASIQDASVLLPVLAPDMPSKNICGLIYNGLVKYDQNINLVGDLAERWEISKDQKTIRFILRKDVKWHDGQPFTARDVEYTYNVYVDPKTPTPYASDFERVKEFSVIDDYTIEVVYQKPYAPALGSWSEGMLPRHLLEGKDITKSPLIRSPIGTGPYKFVEWYEGDKIVLEANPDYYLGKPYIEKLVIKILLDKATAFLELKGGNVDVLALTPLQFKRQTNSARFKREFKKYKHLSFSYNYLAYNLQDWKFKDKRVRQALTMGINRQSIVQGVLLGLGQVAHTPYHPETYWYNSKVKKFPYDPKRARKLLHQAGWNDSDGDGIIDKEGKPFEFTIITNQGDDRRRNAATIIQHNLGDVGIRVHIRVLEWAALLNDFLYNRRFEACIIGWALDYDPNQNDKWSSQKTGPHDYNWMNYQNPEVDRLLELGVSTCDKKARKKHYDRLQEILAEDQPCTFLWVHHALPIAHARIYGIKPSPIGLYHNIHRWYVPSYLQKYMVETRPGTSDM